MIRTLILALILTGSAHAQMPFAFWKPATSTAYTFKPSDITGLKLWLYADTLKTLESKSVGDTLYRWQDISGDGTHVVNTTASRKPVLRDSATVWGAPGGTVQFDGSDDLLTNNATYLYDTTNGVTVFMVLRLVGFASNASRAPISLIASNYAPPFVTFASTDGNYRDMSVGYADLGATRNARFTTYVPTSTSVVTITSRGTYASGHGMRVDSTTLAQAGQPSYGTVSAAKIQISGYEPGLARWNGHIMEVAVYSGILSITDIRRVEEYLRRKYSL